MGAIEGFYFISDWLALDLVNTEAMARGKPVDFLRHPADAAQWWAQARELHAVPELPASDSAFDEGLLAALKGLRGALRRGCDALVASGRPSDADVAEINRQLARGHPQLMAGGEAPRADYLIEGSTAERILFRIALSALRLFTTQDLARLHRCQNNRCVLFFYDTTKSATRRWCSPACMNRARSLQNYAARREGE